MDLVDIADEIFRELGEPDDISIPSITFWLLSNTGSFGDLINVDIAIENSELVPTLTYPQKDIFKTLYFIYYYNRQVSKNLGAAAYSSFIEIKEGDRTVKRTNKNEIAKNWAGLMRSATDSLNLKMLAYKQRANSGDVISLANPNDEYWDTAYGGPRNLFNFSRRS